jgi:hypothetical protein
MGTSTRSSTRWSTSRSARLQRSARGNHLGGQFTRGRWCYLVRPRNAARSSVRYGDHPAPPLAPSQLAAMNTQRLHSFRAHDRFIRGSRVTSGRSARTHGESSEARHRGAHLPDPQRHRQGPALRVTRSSPAGHQGQQTGQGEAGRSLCSGHVGTGSAERGAGHHRGRHSGMGPRG